jgi:hypothetical protein
MGEKYVLRFAETAPGINMRVFEQQQGVGLTAVANRLGQGDLLIPGPAILH